MQWHCPVLAGQRSFVSHFAPRAFPDLCFSVPFKIRYSNSRLELVVQVTYKSRDPRHRLVLMFRSLTLIAQDHWPNNRTEWQVNIPSRSPNHPPPAPFIVKKTKEKKHPGQLKPPQTGNTIQKRITWARDWKSEMGGGFRSPPLLSLSLAPSRPTLIRKDPAPWKEGGAKKSRGRGK